jgi:hypothetical protein
MTAEDIAKVLGGRRAGASWMARCPAHNDRDPNLSIRQAEDGTVLVRCHFTRRQTGAASTTSRSASTTKIADSVAPLEFAFIWKRT